jgi:arylsulfatase A-like enzyme/Flp pilus assembly protein TadD
VAATKAKGGFGATVWFGIVLTVGLIAGAWWLTRPAPAGPIILISIDTLRADHLSLYGYNKGRTPNIEALARDGVVFERAYAHAPQTLPSHTSILTGQLPFEHGVRDNIGFTVKPNTTTLASLLHGAGYGTGGFVSAYVLRAETGINQGFDVYNADFPAGALDRPLAQVQRPAPDTVSAAVTWLNTHVDPKVFLFLHLYEPHRPYDPPAPYKDLAPYDGEIAAADAAVGTLIAELKKRDWYDNATIALVADHGEGLGDHGEEEHGLFLYESTIHVPFVLKLPRARKFAGKRVAQPVQHIDLVPTFAAIAGFAVPQGLRGRNLLPVATTGTLAEQGIYSEAMMSRYHFGWSELTSLTDARYKFIRAPKPELYDLERDRGEAANVIGENAQIAQAMRGGLEGLIAGRSLDAPGSVSSEDRQRLAALGYIGSSNVSVETSGLTLPDPKDKSEILRAFTRAAKAIGDLQFVEAADQLKWVTAQDPGMTDAWNQYAQVLIRLGRNEDALKAYREILNRRPGAAPVLLDTAIVLMKLGRLDEAREHAELAVSGSPVSAHQLLVKIAFERQRPDDAIKEAKLAEAADPTLPMTDFVQGVILHREGKTDPAKFAEAIPFFERAASRIKGRTVQIDDLYYNLGDSLAQVGRLEEAEHAFLEEIRLFPNLIHARSGLAMLYEASGRTPDADRAVASMLAAVPTPVTYATAAELWRVLGHPDKSAAVAAAARAKFGGK